LSNVYQELVTCILRYLILVDIHLTLRYREYTIALNSTFGGFITDVMKVLRDMKRCGLDICTGTNKIQKTDLNKLQAEDSKPVQDGKIKSQNFNVATIF
jgi:hypothetical protein